jgi:molybdopterin synthase sulfur carrier subunit
MVKENTTISDLISALKIPDDLVKLVFVNGVRQERTYTLKPDDRVGLFPPVGGG